ncbi:MAG: DUF3540 domain-containing protein [Myxococcota bacterium]
MKNRTSHPPPDPADLVVQWRGDLIAIEGDHHLVRHRGGSVSARVAVSCLVRPEAGDTVLVASAGVDHHVLAILSRPESGVVIETEAPLTIRSSALELTGEAVTICGDTTTLGGDEVRVFGRVGEVAVSQLSLLGRSVTARWMSVRTVADGVDAVLGRVVQRMRSHLRFVEETERVDAGDIELSAERAITAHAHDAVVLAEDLVKLDGEQVHVG